MIRALAAALLAAVQVTPVPAPNPAARPLPVRVIGRAERVGGEWVRQWPGTAWETAFRGTAALVRVGAGEVALHVRVDGRIVRTLIRPAPGLYRVTGLAPGQHVLRVEVASESQAGPTRFGGFLAPAGAVPAPLAAPRRQIEFIGDSHTVGYGNTASKTECTQGEVWRTTDTSQAFGPALARRYGADYRVHAISGRGVVRNYDGFAAPTLPEAYPFTLFEQRTRAADAGWRPQAIAVALGTNDFSTPLRAGERWPTRAALHADFETTYARFLRTLRARDPHALIVVWATDLAGGEIAAEAARVVATLRAAGDRRIVFTPVTGLRFGGCHGHPSLADERTIADRLAAALDARGDVWR